jgi:hypothetical protein
MGEPGRRAMRGLGPPAFHDLLHLCRSANAGCAFESLRAVKGEFLDVALAELDGPDQDPEPFVAPERLFIEGALIELAEPSLVPRLVRCLDQARRPRTAAVCAEVLGRLGGAETVTGLIRALRRRDDEAGAAAAKGLTAIGPAAVPELVAAFADLARELAYGVVAARGGIVLMFVAVAVVFVFYLRFGRV